MTNVEKARILLTMHYLEIGGAETALIGLMNALDPQRVSVDLFLHDHRGEMMRFVPGWVNVLPPVRGYAMLERPMREVVRRGHWGIAAARLLAKIVSKRAYRKGGSALPNSSIFHYVAKYTTPLLPRINPGVTYDLAVSFLTPHQVTLQKVKARKRVAWIHTDYTKIWVDANDELPVWQAYDRIASISDDVTRTFLSIFPTLAPKVCLIENILAPAFVRRRADEVAEADVVAELERMARRGGGKIAHHRPLQPSEEF